jgi:DNA-binding transcriptional MerR regulator
MEQLNFLSIGNVAEQISVPAHTIRYWEKEFSEFLRPQRGNGSRRKFGEYEVELLLRIKKMVWEEKYSIAGARQKLRNILIGKNASEEDFESLITLRDKTISGKAAIA